MKEKWLRKFKFLANDTANIQSQLVRNQPCCDPIMRAPLGESGTQTKGSRARQPESLLTEKLGELFLIYISISPSEIIKTFNSFLRSLFLSDSLKSLSLLFSSKVYLWV